MEKRILILLFTMSFSLLGYSQKAKTYASAGSKLVLSYNICWNCMTNNSHKGSAKVLGGKCTLAGKDTTICAEHMADLIDQIPGDYGMSNFDFVGLQESSNGDVLQELAEKTLNKMEAIWAEEGYEYAMTLYDPQKYTVQHYFDGAISRGRPFQITVFKEGIIFLNVHNDHGEYYDLDRVTNILSSKLKSSLSYHEIQAIKNYRIIAVGDYNEAHTDRTYISFQPLQYAGITTSVSLKKAPITCCDTKGVPWRGYRDGDFVFDSDNTAAPIVPTNYDKEVLQSDHLPVVAKLQ